MFFRHWTKRLIYTEGIHQLAEEHGAYWLIDVIASYQGTFSDPRLNDFQLWTLKVHDKRGMITCRADSGERPAAKQCFEYTDYPSGTLKLYVERGEEMTLMLPEER